MLRVSFLALAPCVLLSAQTFVPTGKSVTPNAVPNATFQPLNPQAPALPNLDVGQAVATAISPDGKTLLVLTSGYNKFNLPGGTQLLNEYVFVFDISQNAPVQTQVLGVPNTFNGIAWNPTGTEFYVSGGSDDNAHVFGNSGGAWTEVALIPLGHKSGLGLNNAPLAAGIAVNATGTAGLVANFENDSVTLLDLTKRSAVAEIDLRPGIANAALTGVAGGEYPFGVVIVGNSKGYISSVRDRELVVVDMGSGTISGRIPVRGQPNKITLNKAQSRLYVALDNSDSVAVIDTASDTVIETFETTAPDWAYPSGARLRGVNPNNVALSPDETTLYVTNGGSNSVAVVQLRQDPSSVSQVVGLIPTGWYPNAVSISADGSTLYVVNGKSAPGPNPQGALGPAGNQYVWQLTQAGLLTIPVPDSNSLQGLTIQVAANNNFPSSGLTDAQMTMAALREKIQHVIYIVKENKTYDQVLGDLEKGNGDATLTMFPEPLTPNHHQLARQFVVFDNFYDTAEVSGNGWNWSTAARATDIVDKTVPLNYAGRGGAYDWEGNNRNVNVGLESVADRKAENQAYPNDPNLLPGPRDVSAPDGPDGETGAGYLWDAASQAGLTIRNYGFFVNAPQGSRISAQPFADGVIEASPTKQALNGVTDLYFRGFDMRNADFYLVKEWEREFDAFAAQDSLPNLMLVRLPHDHTGNFGGALFGVNTPDTQVADNDYAIGLVAQKVAGSNYKDSTLIFIVEDDAQDGSDHVDAHRSVAYIVGPFVKQGAVVSTAYTTVSLIRTIKDVLGITAMNFYDGLATPMADAFDLSQTEWNYQAIVPEVLRTTQLPLPPRSTRNRPKAYSKPRHSAAYWEKKLGNQDFSEEDKLDTNRYNRVLWEGLMGKKPGAVDR
ncbi:MAG TPA: beta-propeller fold lactonase family protein [Bryobacteraceae bacterium]|nr:beta-propeller fold lactonase family protein [Bryobacteraceae bacterium]